MGGGGGGWKKGELGEGGEGVKKSGEETGRIGWR